MNDKYKSTWLAFVNIVAENGKITDLIDLEGVEDNSDYSGAWANIIVKGTTIKEAIEIIPLGLEELGFSVDFIDKIENISSLIEYDEIDENVIKEVDWLLSTDYVFKVSDKLFPYESNESIS